MKEVAPAAGLSIEEIEKVFAVEGIVLTQEMKQGLEDVAAGKISGEEQRRRFARKYGKST